MPELLSNFAESAELIAELISSKIQNRARATGQPNNINIRIFITSIGWVPLRDL